MSLALNTKAPNSVLHPTAPSIVMDLSPSPGQPKLTSMLISSGPKNQQAMYSQTWAVPDYQSLHPPQNARQSRDPTLKVNLYQSAAPKHSTQSPQDTQMWFQHLTAVTIL